MSRLALKGIQAAAGNAAGEGLYVEEVFSTYLYEGAGIAQTITNGIDLDGEGGLVWIKQRSGAGWHGLIDTARGRQSILFSNTTGSATTDSSSTQDLTSFNSNGFSLGSQLNFSCNSLSEDYASWTFRKAPKFFDVVTYTGDGTAGRTVSHNLGSVPGSIFFKRLDSGTDTNWRVYHRSLGATKTLKLNTTDAEQVFADVLNNTSPTSTVFTVGSFGDVNASGGTYVAYLFAHNDGDGEFGEDSDQDIIKCGSYTGNGTDGFEVDLGFEPQWILFKNASVSDNWLIFDVMRGISTPYPDPLLRPNLSNAEDVFATTNYVNVQATGFSVGSNPGVNGSGNTIIYIAIRRGPMKTPESGTEVFAPISWTGDGTQNRVLSTGFAVDAVWNKYALTTSNSRGLSYNRLTSSEYLQLDSTNAADTNTLGILYFDLNNGIDLGASSGFDKNASGSSHVGYNFKRAPGYFDVVAYTGDGVNPRLVTHNLSVIPEMIIIKKRSGEGNWWTWVNGLTDDATYARNLQLSETNAQASNNVFYKSSDQSSTAFKIGAGFNGANDSSATYIAYLFATVAGVSKVGSYTGTGADLNVDCGFSAGARFVLIKRTDSTGDWYVWDSERGIVAGNDPYLLLNSTAVQVTNTDYIDPLSSGFTVTSSAPAALNNSGGTYIFLAIA